MSKIRCPHHILTLDNLSKCSNTNRVLVRTIQKLTDVECDVGYVCSHSQRVFTDGLLRFDCRLSRGEADTNARSSAVVLAQSGVISLASYPEIVGVLACDKLACACRCGDHVDMFE